MWRDEREREREKATQSKWAWEEKQHKSGTGAIILSTVSQWVGPLILASLTQALRNLCVSSAAVAAAVAVASGAVDCQDGGVGMDGVAYIGPGV